MSIVITPKKEKSFITILKITLLLVSLLVSMLTKNTWIAFFSVVVLILHDKKYLIPCILVVPVVANILIAGTGVTLTKLLIIFIVTLLLFELILKKKLIFDRKIQLISLYLMITIIGVLNSVLISDDPLLYGHYSSVVSETFLTYVPQIIFVILLYQFLTNKDILFIKQSFEISKWIISIFLIIISVYFMTIGSTTSNWNNVAMRLIFTATDPNEFAAMLVSLSVFPMFMMFKGERKIEIILGIFSTLITFYSIFLTLSRDGFLTLIITFLICTAVFAKKSKFRMFLLGIILIIIFLFLIGSGILNFDSMYERFFGNKIGNLSDLTAGRFDLWKIAIYAIESRPIFGYGGSSLNVLWITFQSIGEYKAIHNTYLEIIVRYGIIGFLSFVSIIFVAFRDLYYIKKHPFSMQDPILLLPFISLIALLFAGIALSWLWKELLWFMIGISLSVGTVFKRNI